VAPHGATCARVVECNHVDVAFFVDTDPIGIPVKRLFSATINSWRAIGYGFRSEAALREEMVLLVAGALLGLIAAPSGAWYVLMVGSLLILLAVEFLNTAIEKLADYVTREQHVAIRRVKDFGSAAVFCAICLAGLIWLVALAVRFGLAR
jgi:diacylglycerol kinase (ATP)